MRMQNHSNSKISSGDARQVFRQFAWNLAGSLKSPRTSKTKNTQRKTPTKRGKNK